MTASIDTERELLLPKIERDQRELRGAVEDLEAASRAVLRRWGAWLAVLSGLTIAAWVARRVF
ncbi:MAG: hypothetical protein ACREQQ_04900 [Candidatus Binatia bacterium]